MYEYPLGRFGDSKNGLLNEYRHQIRNCSPKPVNTYRRNTQREVSMALVGMEGYFSIDKRRAKSKDSLEIIKYIVVK